MRACRDDASFCPACALAQTTPPPQRRRRRAAGRRSRSIEYVVGQAKPPEVPGTAVMDLTLEQAVQIALEKNLTLKAAKLNPQLIDYSLQSARAAFLPRYSSTLFDQQLDLAVERHAPTASTTSPATAQNFNGTFTQLLPWYGGNFNVNFTNNRQAVTNSARTAVQPGVQLAARLSLHAAAAGRLQDGQHAQRAAHRRDSAADRRHPAADHDREHCAPTCAGLLEAAVGHRTDRDLSGARWSSRSGQWEDSKIRVEIGTLAPIETVQFEVAGRPTPNRRCSTRRSAGGRPS